MVEKLKMIHRENFFVLFGLLLCFIVTHVHALESKEFTEKEMGEISQKLVSCNKELASEALDKLISKQESQYLQILSGRFPIDFYWVGRKDEAVFWLELYLLRKRQEIELRQLKDTIKFFDGPAPYLTIHNYSRQNLYNYINITEKVVDWDKTHWSYLSKYKGYNEFSKRAEEIRREFLSEKRGLLQYKNNIESYEKHDNDIM